MMVGWLGMFNTAKEALDALAKDHTVTLSAEDHIKLVAAAKIEMNEHKAKTGEKLL